MKRRRRNGRCTRFGLFFPPLAVMMSLVFVLLCGGCEKAPVPGRRGGGDETLSAAAEAEEPMPDENGRLRGAAAAGAVLGAVVLLKKICPSSNP